MHGKISSNLSATLQMRYQQANTAELLYTAAARYVLPRYASSAQFLEMQALTYQNVLRLLPTFLVLHTAVIPGSLGVSL